MGMYDAQCNACDNQYEYFSTIAERGDVPRCPLCNAPGRRAILTAPRGFVKGKFEPFKSPVDGSVISTASRLAEHNKRNNVSNLHDGFSEDSIMKGDFGNKPFVNDTKDVAVDVQEAIHAVTEGYVPTIGAQEDE